METSPYAKQPCSEWSAITAVLVERFPSSMPTLVHMVELAWTDLYRASFGDTELRIGIDIFLPAQATGVILEHLVAIHLHKNFADWREGNTKIEKDIVYDPELKYSFEIKT